MLTEPLSRVRDWALFALAALLPAIALGVLGLRALSNEESAIEREAKVAIEASTDRIARSIAPGLDAAARTLANGSVDADRLAKASPPYAEPLLLDRDRMMPEIRGEERGAVPSPSTIRRCQDGLDRLAALREPAARSQLRAELLASCSEARTAGDRWMYPLLVVEGFSAEDAAPFVTWTSTHGARLSAVERAAVREDARLLPLDSSSHEAVKRALQGDRHERAALSLLLRESEAAEALRRGPDASGAITWRAPESLGSLRRLEDGGFAGFVAHRASIEAALEGPWSGLSPELRASVERSFAANAGELVATRPITQELSLTVRLRDPALLARRTRRSLFILMSLAIGATLAAFAIGASLFARMRAARRASELRTDFVAAVSHELRTPIASVRMLAELLEENRVEDEERDEVHAALAAESRRLSTTVERLLSFARMASGKRKIVRAWHPVAKVVGESIDVFDGRSSGAPPVVRDLDEALEASIDQDEIRVAVDNLLANARKYAPEGAPYTVRVAAEADGVVIAVTDHGPGIAGRDQRRIFEPFERADDRLSQATSGSGIGLSLVRNVARAHGGDVRVDSAPGETRFTIWIPRGTP